MFKKDDTLLKEVKSVQTSFYINFSTVFELISPEITLNWESNLIHSYVYDRKDRIANLR